MSDLVWYVYQQGKQLGPFEQSQILQMLTGKMIAEDAYLFRVGWKDWRPLEDTYEELGMPTKSKGASIMRRLGAPRASIQGRVIVHNNGQLVIGSGVNISATGIFVETIDEIFSIGEMLKLTCRCDGIAKPFNVLAKVIRFNSDARFPIGYGLQFENLEVEIKHEIEKLVEKQNIERDESRVAT